MVRVLVVFVQPNKKNALGIFLDQDNHASQTLRLGWEELEETFGDRLVMTSHEETEYALCAI